MPSVVSITNYASTTLSMFETSTSSGQARSTVIIYGTGFCLASTVMFNGVSVGDRDLNRCGARRTRNGSRERDSGG
jgi:hypothetical protein